MNDGISAEEYVTAAERLAEIDAVAEDLRSAVRKHFPRTRNLEYAVLKAHLIVEHALTHFLRCSFPVVITPEAIDFSFSQKLTLAYFHGLTDRCMLPSIELLNRARNQVAHRFTLDRAIIDEMIRLNSEDYDSFSISNDIHRIRGLRWLCHAICGQCAGYAAARLAEGLTSRCS